MEQKLFAGNVEVWSGSNLARNKKKNHSENIQHFEHLQHFQHLTTFSTFTTISTCYIDNLCNYGSFISISKF